MLSEVRRPIRELRKSLRDLPGNPPQRAVHNLRTRSRRLEAISTALPRNGNGTARQLLKSIKPLRKAAGEVRDMDVLEAKVRLLFRRTHNESFERLLTHLKTVRAQSARELIESLSNDRKEICRGLKQFSKEVKHYFSDSYPDARQAERLFEELSHWPRLSGANLHQFRVRIKALRYMMQLIEGANSDFMDMLEKAKVRIGAWHDWQVLHGIAKEIFDATSDGAALASIAEAESRNFKTAMQAAQALRRRYLRARSVIEFAEP